MHSTRTKGWIGSLSVRYTTLGMYSLPRSVCLAPPDSSLYRCLEKLLLSGQRFSPRFATRSWCFKNKIIIALSAPFVNMQFSQDFKSIFVRIVEKKRGSAVADPQRKQIIWYHKSWQFRQTAPPTSHAKIDTRIPRGRERCARYSF